MPSSRPELRNILTASRRIPRAPFRPLSTSAPILRPTDEESHFTRAPKTTPEKSQTDSLQHTQFNDLWSQLHQEWPKQSTNKNSPQSISSFLDLSSSNVIPRPLRGARSRMARSSGVTPPEADVFNEVISSILTSFPSAPSDPFLATKSGVTGYGSNEWGDGAKQLRTIFDRNRSEDDNLEEYEMLAEEMDMVSSDLELVEWAKKRVFTPIDSLKSDEGTENVMTSVEDESSATASATPESSQSATTSSHQNTYKAPANLLPLLTFSPVYPKILARVLKTLRENFNSPHLVLALFHHAQTSSVESYLFGCLTGAYNEVLTCRWESFRDLDGVQRGIREMEMMGIKWDKDTNRLVSRVVDEAGREILQGGRWGEDALQTLQQLERKLESDVVEEERYHEFERKKRKRERERRESGADGEQWEAERALSML
ncbi:hypothetical protein I307_01196 [Cryptococcus deuterogattii 99/473]|uniref:Mtf2-like C-terminal domain-containing protein n=1 Tax=Cryptococcus deuterogattii Ram5 TaxID=1296110 RepID=A0A0D0V8J9_9TREE|nr:hypothetical protein I313_01049 [Cryptococcus deuterogattii Ram5]KIY59525.1 hypothetical protein I307_01196 [Cryptococcus deuterogattii 99/473]